jgi:hypothetical protein
MPVADTVSYQKSDIDSQNNNSQNNKNSQNNNRNLQNKHEQIFKTMHKNTEKIVTGNKKIKIK